MKKGIVTSVILAGLALLAMAACTREPFDELGGNGEIAFDASSTWLNDEGTRTEYSGLSYTISGDGTYERINWVQNTDLIRVYCKQAYIDGSSNKYSDYKIASEPSEEAQKSVAQVAPASTDNTLRWGNGTHTFYALYPAPGTKWKYDNDKQVSPDDAKISASGDNAIIEGSIPAEQVVKLNGTEYEPNMNYAYMYAIKQVSAKRGVTLSFKPLVTAIQFTVKAGDSGIAGKTLSGFKLKSNTVNLNGNFKATLTPSGGCTIEDNGGSASDRKEVHVSIATDDRRQLSTSSAFKITLLTLAVNDLTQLSVELSFTDNSKRTLELKKKSGSSWEWITVAKCCKAYINNLTVPGTVWTYSFGGTFSNKSIGYTGGSQTFATGVTSSRTNGVRTEAVSYTIQYNYNGTWVNSPPDWLSLSGVNTNGGTSAQTITATVTGRPELTNDTHHTTLANSSRARGTASAPFDLSTYNVATTTWANNTSSTISRTTANCYVVQGYGYYKFPLVYGNGVKNGSANPSAYRAKAGASASSYRADAGATHYLGSFRDHEDNYIYNNNNSTSSPYLTTHLNKTSDKFEAFIIWQDEPELITDVGIIGSGTDTYVKFNVPKEHITQGNALIGVKVKADGKIAWSWHIWITDANLTSCKYGPTSTQSTQYYSAPLNIGWCDGKANRQYASRTCQIKFTQTGSNPSNTATATITQSGTTENNTATGGNSPFYQWGRKDPLAATTGTKVDGWGGTDKTYYYASGYSYSHVSTKQTIGSAIQNPTKHYSNGGGDDWWKVNWCSTDWFNLWSSTLNGYGRTQYADAKTKTIYDPSPVGFRVPSVDVYETLDASSGAYFTYSNASDPWGRTYTPSGLFYPSGGQRAASDGEPGNNGYLGMYWSSQVYGDSKGYCGHNLYFNTTSSGIWTWTGSAAKEFANGFPVRPVKE